MVLDICCAETADVFPGITARNKAVLEYEKFVHRTFYPFIIHPYSRFRVYWEIFFLFFIPFMLITETLLWVFLSADSLLYVFIVTLSGIITLVDIVLRFFTGYVELKTDIVVLDPKKIKFAYLLRSFIFDLIPCIPINMILYIFPQHGFKFYDRGDPWGMSLYCIRILIFLRVVSFFLYMYHTSNLFMWYPYLLGMVGTICLIFLFFLFIINSVRVWAFSQSNRDLVHYVLHILTVKERLEVFYNFIKIIVKYLNDTYYSRPSDFILHTSYLLVFFFCSIFLIVYLIKFTLLKLKRQEMFQELESGILSFAKKRHLSVASTEKVLLYFLILLENKYCREDEVFHYIPNTFKAEIFYHLCLPLLKNFHAFEDLPTYVLRRLAECLVYQLHLPNELAMTMTEQKLRMYFIQRGTVALYSANHVELYHFEAGSSINGRNFILGENSNSHYAISIEVTEIYRLDYAKYMNIMSAYPALLRNIMRKFQLMKTKSSFGGYTSLWD